MILKKAKDGDLVCYLQKQYENLTWLDRSKLLLEISKALNSIHQLKSLHKDFYSKNIFVDDKSKNLYWRFWIMST